MSSVTILRLDDTNTLVIRKEDNNFFATGDDTFIITVPNLSYLLKYMLLSGVISPKVIQAVLDEHYAMRENS